MVQPHLALCALHYVAQNYTVLHTIILCCTQLKCFKLCYSKISCMELCCTKVYHVAQNYTTLHKIILCCIKSKCATKACTTNRTGLQQRLFLLQCTGPQLIPVDLICAAPSLICQCSQFPRAPFSSRNCNSKSILFCNEQY